jgi:transposase
MAKPYSQDLRDRVIDAVEQDGMSRRAAARRYQISESVAVKWLERLERAGSRKPVGHGGHRPSPLMPHRDFLEAARVEKPDITLQGLCNRLSCERGVKADPSMMSRFFRRLGVTLEKDARRVRTGPRGRKAPSRALAKLSALDRPQAPGFHRRDLGQDQHDAPVRLGAQGPAADRQSPSRPLDDRDFPGRPAQRPHRRSLSVRRPHQWRALSRLRRTVPRPDPQATRRRDVDNLGSHKAKAVRQAIRAVGARLVFLPKYSPDLNPIEQVFAKFKTLLRNAEARTYDAVAGPPPMSSPNTIPKNAKHTSGTQVMHKPKCKTL